MINTVLFDMDGVLIDAKKWHFDALNLALDIFGFKISDDEHERTYDGLPTYKKLEMLSERHGLPVGLHEFLNALKQRHTEDFIHTKCVPTFSHQFLIKKLKEKKYNTAVCSNSIRSSMELMLGRAQVLHLFDFILSNEDVSAPKPSPEIYLLAMKKFNVLPETCIIIEDNPNGIAAAKASGAYVVEVSDPSVLSWDLIEAEINKANE